RRHRRAPCPQRGAVVQPRPRRARRLLPTDRRARDGRPRGRRGAGPLEPPDAGHGPARRVHPAGRGERGDPDPRSVGARGGLPPAHGRTVTVNLPAAQLREPTFLDDIDRTISASGLRPEQLVLEMTETAMFHDTTTTIARLDALRARGIRIAVDDFGTGYSSL